MSKREFITCPLRGNSNQCTYSIRRCQRRPAQINFELTCSTKSLKSVNRNCNPNIADSISIRTFLFGGQTESFPSAVWQICIFIPNLQTVSSEGKMTRNFKILLKNFETTNSVSFQPMSQKIKRICQKKELFIKVYPEKNHDQVKKACV